MNYHVDAHGLNLTTVRDHLADEGVAVEACKGVQLRTSDMNPRQVREFEKRFNVSLRPAPAVVNPEGRPHERPSIGLFKRLDEIRQRRSA